MSEIKLFCQNFEIAIFTRFYLNILTLLADLFKNEVFGNNEVGEILLCAMETSRKPRDSDGFWYIEDRYKI